MYSQKINIRSRREACSQASWEFKLNTFPLALLWDDIQDSTMMVLRVLCSLNLEFHEALTMNFLQSNHELALRRKRGKLKRSEANDDWTNVNNGSVETKMWKAHSKKATFHGRFFLMNFLFFSANSRRLFFSSLYASPNYDSSFHFPSLAAAAILNFISPHFTNFNFFRTKLTTTPPLEIERFVITSSSFTWWQWRNSLLIWWFSSHQQRHRRARDKNSIFLLARPCLR